MPTDIRAPIPRVAITLVDNAAQRLRLGRRPLDAGLVNRAERRAGQRFRSRDFEPALAQLADACGREADLNVFGRLSFRWDMLRLLRNVLRLEKAEEEDPGIVGAEITSPLFVTGLPRSGTTFLHMLLALDPGHRAPLCYETMQPYPDAGAGKRDRRIRRVEMQFRSFRRIAPGIRRLHPLAATTPQECTEITAHVFQSMRFDTTYYVPSYLAWLERRGHAAAFRFHKRFLQHLQAQQPSGGTSWVLKCPDHVFALDDIVNVYPDARFVFLHRDPAAVLPSVAKLTEVLRGPFVRSIDRKAIGAEVTRRCLQASARMLAAADRLEEGQALHLRYDEVTAAPMRALERLYSHFQAPFGAEARRRIQAFLDGHPRGGYEVNHYDPAEFGLDAGRARGEFAAYMGAFGVRAAHG
jgi:hypothetical protein